MGSVPTNRTLIYCFATLVHMYVYNLKLSWLNFCLLGAGFLSSVFTVVLETVGGQSVAVHVPRGSVRACFCVLMSRFVRACVCVCMKEGLVNLILNLRTIIF